ncbi:sugar phosphorylase [Botrimarina hoheduenensis]|uniref:Sucrose phosphorylase n=1 Tax=Botrimarina hoheduenensis TaxID=2528000 RepID=A0A5C5W7F8_9BACT|nr:sugar phosphorylase [Botrimarina hoheduenensis]TWT46808.1 Sucrose phosphorylase [Botrimarina hoheduenensis]
MSIADRVASLRERLARIYGQRAEEALAAFDVEFADLIGADTLGNHDGASGTGPAWSERDVVLITYADQLREDQQSVSPLVALREWLVEHRLEKLLSTVHLLPFCPFSSDDGFSVIDYLAVDPASGTWDDIAALGVPFDLMFDLVLNHISQHSEWFAAYRRGETPYDRFFIEADPTLDYALVTRPRSLPLLTPVETVDGERHVWTTFSADQIDLDYREPVVMARMLRILVEYARRGARIVRLDAVAFLWKRLGTTCMHLPETHEAVKLMRDVTAAFAPRTLMLTETNVPHAENVSYFGGTRPGAAGDEAHMVYQFSLPPLLLEAFLSEDATALRDWLAKLAPPPAGCTFFNFTASHDGVGVRPLEGLVSPERFAALVDAVRKRGAIVNTRRQADGSDTPYELCVAYFSALAPESPDEELHGRRFLASQAVMLALQGMPAVYFHSLVGTPNDTPAAQTSGIARRINRRKYERAELAEALEPGTLQGQVFRGYQELLAKRVAEPAFHPEAAQTVVESGSALLAFDRDRRDGSGRVRVVVNVSCQDQEIDLPPAYAAAHDLITGAVVRVGRFRLAAGQCVWLFAATPV